MNFGIPYKGSKNRIASSLISCMPPAETFVDLFAGGCSMIHCAMLSGKFRKFIANDIDGDGIRLFVNSVHGKYRNEKRVISREDFFRLKDSDQYIKFCWSFGNNGVDYLWGKDLEDMKLRACKIILADTIKERRKAYMDFIKSVQEKMKEHPELLRKRMDLEALERLERIKDLQTSFQDYKDLQTSFQDYQEVEIPYKNSTVYCDIPYKDKSGYLVQFDYDRFFNWALEQEYPVFISSFELPDDFKCIFKIRKAASYSGGSKIVMEKLFVQRRFADRFIQQKKEQYSEVQV